MPSLKDAIKYAAQANPRVIDVKEIENEIQCIMVADLWCESLRDIAREIERIRTVEAHFAAKRVAARYVPDPSRSTDGSCLQGETRALTYAQIHAVLGEPLPHSDEYKVSTEWVVRDVKTNRTFTVYDYKETCLYDENLPSVADFRANKYGYNWHIGSRSRDGVGEFIAWLEGEALKHG